MVSVLEEEVLVVVGGIEGGGDGSSPHLVSMILGSSSPFFTLMSVDMNWVELEAFRPRVFLPWAKDFALLKHQFWDPGFQL